MATEHEQSWSPAPIPPLDLPLGDPPLTLRCRGRGGRVAQRRYDHERWARQQAREEQRQRRADLAAQKAVEREHKQEAIEAGRAQAEQHNEPFRATS